MGPNVFGGYWERPDATAEAFTDDGWFRTGDIGELDDDGYLRLVGRASDLIISGGYNVYPREVEDAVLEHPDVVDAAVVGVPDDTWGETVVAFVVLRDGARTPTLLADALDRPRRRRGSRRTSGRGAGRCAPTSRATRWARSCATSSADRPDVPTLRPAGVWTHLDGGG